MVQQNGTTFRAPMLTSARGSSLMVNSSIGSVFKVQRVFKDVKAPVNRSPSHRYKFTLQVEISGEQIAAWMSGHLIYK